MSVQIGDKGRASKYRWWDRTRTKKPRGTRYSAGIFAKLWELALRENLCMEGAGRGAWGSRLTTGRKGAKGLLLLDRPR